MIANGAWPLLAAFPSLRDTLPCAPIGVWPTPVQELPRLAASIGSGPLYVKRDDLSASPYGGNKVRKLEVLLGDALAQGAREIITFGAAGSNHAVATAVYGGALGFHVTSMLTRQPNARYVRRNLLTHLASGAAVRLHGDYEAASKDAETLASELLERTGMAPYVIPFGGTSALSTAGFVNAGLELAGQIERGDAPSPDVIYLPLGSMGTAAGVALGMALGGFTPVVRAVRVVPDTIANIDALHALLSATIELLRERGAEIPPDIASRMNIEVVPGFFGEGYARFTPEGMDAVELAAGESIRLEGTYTGKTMAALVAHARAGVLEGSTVLFWDTFNSRDMGEFVGDRDYHELPEAAHVYFESAVQPLDAEGN